MNTCVAFSLHEKSNEPFKCILSSKAGITSANHMAFNSAFSSNSPSQIKNFILFFTLCTFSICFSTYVPQYSFSCYIWYILSRFLAFSYHEHLESVFETSIYLVLFLHDFFFLLFLFKSLSGFSAQFLCFLNMR